MADVQDYCFKHASYYSGWQCPLCAKEKEDDPLLRPGSSGGGRGGAGASAGSGGVPSRKAAQELSHEAMLMLHSGSPKDALAQCERALDLDAYNLEAHVVGVRACQALRDRSGEIDFFDHALRVLASEEHRSSPASYHSMLGCARDTAQVRQVVGAFVTSRTWSARDALPFVQALDSRGLPSEAARVLDELPPAEESLLILGFRAHLNPTVTKASDFDSYLSRMRPENRDRLLVEFHELSESRVVPAGIILKVRDSILRRYHDWQAAIFPLLEVDARRVAEERVAGAAATRALAVAGQVLAAGAVLVVVLALAIGGGPLLFLGGVVLTLLTAGGAYAFTRQTEIDKHAPPLVPGILDAMVQHERARWEGLLGEETAATTAPEEVAEESSASQAACTACGNPLAADEAICPACNAPVAVPPPAAPPEEPEEGQPPS